MIITNNEEERKRPNYLTLVIILIFFLITLGVLIYFIRFKTNIAPQASSYNTTNSVSISNSYVFASPVRALTGGDLIRVTVFVLDAEGNGLFDKAVRLEPNSINVTVKEIQSLTDETGKAIFDVSSNVKGSYLISTYVDGVTLPQNLKIVFD